MISEIICNHSKKRNQQTVSINLDYNIETKLVFYSFCHILTNKIELLKDFYINIQKYDEKDIKSFRNPYTRWLVEDSPYFRPFKKEIFATLRSKDWSYNNSLEISTAIKVWKQEFPKLNKILKNSRKEIYNSNQAEFMSLALEIAYVILLERLLYLYYGGIWREKMCEMLCYALVDLLNITNIQVEEAETILKLAGIFTDIISTKEKKILSIYFLGKSK